jgi:tetratricopeptide (TPR) repeat protein
VSFLLFVSTLLAFFPAIGGAFVFDDKPYISQNPSVQAGLTSDSLRYALTTTDGSNWHPLTWLSWLFEASVFGMKPFFFHLDNVILHAANAVLLFWALRFMSGAVWRSALVAGLFALHPLHVESVAWASERKDVLSTLFGFLTILAYIRYARRPTWLRYLFVAIAFAASLLSKSMLVTLPAVLLLLDYWPMGRFVQLASQAKGNFAPVSLRAAVLEKLPLAVLAFASTIITLKAQAAGSSSMPWADWPLRVENAIYAYVWYIGKMLWPIGLCAYYPYPRELFPGWEIILASLFFLGATAVSVRWSRVRPYVFVGWFWYVGTLLPVIGIVPVVGGQAMADRYTYVPLVGLFIIGSWGLAELASHVRLPATIPATLACGVLAFFFAATWVQAGYWQDGLTLWDHAVAVSDRNYLAENSLGLALKEKGQTAQAVEHYLKAITANPNYDLAHANLGQVFAEQGKLTEAAEQFRLATTLEPQRPGNWYNLGAVRATQEDYADAVACFERTIALQPNSPLCYYDLAHALQELGRPQEARAMYEQAVAKEPRFVPLFNQSAWQLATSPDPRARNGRRALELAKKACAAAKNTNPDYLDTLAAAYAELGRFDEAVASARLALQILEKSHTVGDAQGIRRRLECYEARQPYRGQAKK